MIRVRAARGDESTTLLQNVALNGVGDRVDVLSCALHRSTGVEPFLYGSLEAGSALSHVGGDGPGVRELKAVAAADDLIAAGTLAPAHAIKLDVDGNELDVLPACAGCWAVPTARARCRSRSTRTGRRPCSS